MQADFYEKDGTVLSLAGFSLKLIATPGHTGGSCCYYFAEEGWLFSGDTLFAGSVGRTDFPTGNAQTLLKSLNEVVMSLPDPVVVFPGHGPSTTIGEERATNPFVER